MPTAREIDSNGFLTIKGCPISSFGIFDYGAGQLGLPGDPNRIVKVYRPEVAVSDPAALDSFRVTPLINDHEMLSGFQQDAANTAPEDYGVSGVLTSNVYYEAPWMRGDLKIFARDMQADLQSGKKDLSLGYSCDFEVKPGIFDGQAYEVVQTNLRGNHIALVDEGRVPGARVLDGLCFDHLLFDVRPSDNKDHKMKKTGNATMDNAVAQLQALLPALQQYLAEAAPAPAADPAASAAAPAAQAVDPSSDADAPAAPVDPATAADPNGDGDITLPELIAQIESVLGELKTMAPQAQKEGQEPNAAATEDALKDLAAKDEGAPVEGQGKASPGPSAGEHSSAQDAAIRNFYADAAAKAGLYDRLSPVVGAFDHRAMDANQVAAYGVKKLALKVAKGQERVALDAYLIGIEAAAKTTKQRVVAVADAAVAATSEIDAYLKGA